MAFNFFTAFHRALQDPEAYYSFQKEMNSKAVEQVFFNYYNGITVFEAVVLPVNLGTTYEGSDKILRVRPLGIHDFIIPEPCVFEGELEKIQKILNLHPLAYPDVNSPENGNTETADAGFAVGETVFCRLVEGRSHALVYERDKKGIFGLTSGFNCLSSIDGKTSEELKDLFAKGGYSPNSSGQSSAGVDNVIKKFAQDLPKPDLIAGVYGNNNSKITDFIQKELDFWKGKKEKDSGPEYERLKLYWSNIGWGTGQWTASSKPWSAAFISYVMNKTTAGFKGAPSHYKYTENVVNGLSSGWKAYSLSKGDAKISIGDILVRPRGSGDSSSSEYWYSHGDVVYKIEGNTAILAGGNLGDTAKIASRINLDSNGIAKDTKDYLVILRKVK